ncbi:MAG: cyclic nucleotide-binding domain-containing protein [Wenzhouxiangellaceae bacterium]|nr:cyclic nucleotide-binding domain-containing protein [Wenzhouxiangellaceae bacterium]
MADKDIHEAIATAERFQGLSDEALDHLADHARERNIESGDCLFRHGESARNFFLLLEGRVSIEVPAVSGPTLTVQHLGPGKVLGWSWLLPPFRWSFNARAEQDCRVLEFDGRAILERCEADPAFGYALIKQFSALMAERLDAAHRKMMDQWSPPGFA